MGLDEGVGLAVGVGLEVEVGSGVNWRKERGVAVAGSGVGLDVAVAVGWGVWVGLWVGPMGGRPWGVAVTTGVTGRKVGRGVKVGEGVKVEVGVTGVGVEVGKGVLLGVGEGVEVGVIVGVSVGGARRRTLARASKPDEPTASTQWVPGAAQPAGTTTVCSNEPSGFTWHGPARTRSTASQARTTPPWLPGQAMPVTTNVTSCWPMASVGLTEMPGTAVGVKRGVGSPDLWARAWAGTTMKLRMSTHTRAIIRM